MTECRASANEIDAAGVVLAGGRSSRMGRDKALLPFAGRPLIAHAISILHEAGLTASIAGAGEALRSLASSLPGSPPVIADPEPGLGPLAGICAALQSTTASRAVFLPVDAPFLPPSLLVYMVRHATITGHAVTVPAVNGFVETFPVVIDRATLPILRAELEAGRNGCFSAFQAAASALDQPVSILAVELLAQSGQVSHPRGLAPFRWFLNLNDASALATAEELAIRDIA